MDSKDSLIDKIEEVKKKIAEFESNLNISSIDIDRITVDKKSELINQIENYKSRINSIEKDVVNSKTAYPIEQEPLLSSKKIETPNPANPEIKDKDSYTDIKKTISRVEMEKQEVENINDLLEKLRKNAAEQKKISAAQELKNVQNKTEIKPKDVKPISSNKTADYTGNPYIKSSSVSKVENYSEPAKADSNTVNITENDLHSISELISKLDELLKANKDIADKLNELLKEQKADNSKTSRNDELIKKLAILGSNSNLS
ncbi:hypothetical protein M1558_02785 [Candidatus Parvarchaeota archaeon]|nr:hypothetical protein [Candidatus Parvarchaeota archaeon]